MPISFGCRSTPKPEGSLRTSYENRAFHGEWMAVNSKCLDSFLLGVYTSPKSPSVFSYQTLSFPLLSYIRCDSTSPFCWKLFWCSCNVLGRTVTSTIALWAEMTLSVLGGNCTWGRLKEYIFPIFKYSLCAGGGV